MVSDFVTARTAMVAVDLMPRIIALPLSPHSGSDVLARSLRLASALRSAGGTTVFIRVERPGVADQLSESELDPSCVPLADMVIVKNSWGAFYKTELDEALRARGIDTLILTGIATNFGVESTARAAADHGYRTIYVEDAMSGLDADAHAFAIDYIFPKVGQVTTTDVLLETFSANS